MARPAYVRGQLPVVPTGDWRRKKRTQTNPLSLNTLESVTYSTSKQNEPIDVNSLYFNFLQGKKADFLRNMNGAQAHYSRLAEAEAGNSKLDRWQSHLGSKPEYL